jgi:hypothetical protein
MASKGRSAARNEVLLLQFSREPVAGEVKTRMMPHLTAEQACDLHSELTLWTCSRLVDSGLGVMELAVSGNTQHPLFSQCLDRGARRILRQKGTDLGQRMYRAMGCALTRYTSVILVGSDCPDIDANYLKQAVDALQRVSVVLGPATDGGYVLIGARAIKREFFQDILWGSAQVYHTTVLRLTQAGVSWEALAPLTDIDRPEDLPLWRALQRPHDADPDGA